MARSGCCREANDLDPPDSGTYRKLAVSCHHEGLANTAVGTEDGPQERLVRVLLGSSEPEDLGVMPITDAYELAKELGLLLVDEDDQTVRIYDHGKLVYERDVARRAATRTARRIRRATRSDDQASP